MPIWNLNGVICLLFFYTTLYLSSGADGWISGRLPLTCILSAKFSSLASFMSAATWLTGSMSTLFAPRSVGFFWARDFGFCPKIQFLPYNLVNGLLVTLGETVHFPPFVSELWPSIYTVAVVYSAFKRIDCMSGEKKLAALELKSWK